MKAWTGASFPFAILLCLGALTLWLKHAAEIPEEAPVDKRRHDPDTMIEQFTASTFDQQGRPLHQLSAAQLVHYSDDDSSELMQPSLRYTPSGEAMTLLSARKGKLSNGKDEVKLFDDVRVERAATPAHPGWLAAMPEITAYPPLGKAIAQGKVIFTQGNMKIESLNFSVDQNTQTAVLETNVRGYFPPRISAQP